MTIGKLLWLTGVIHTTVGMKETDGKIYEDDGRWDKDVLANIGVGFCQVQGEKPLETTVVKALLDFPLELRTLESVATAIGNRTALGVKLPREPPLGAEDVVSPIVEHSGQGAFAAAT